MLRVVEHKDKRSLEWSVVGSWLALTFVESGQEYKRGPHIVSKCKNYQSSEQTVKQNMFYPPTLTVYFIMMNFKFIYLFIYGCVGSSFLCEGFL